MDLFLTNTQLWTYKTLIDGLEWCGLLVDYCDVFISCLDSHSDGTHSLQRIHWWASDGNSTFLQIWWRNKLIYISDDLKGITFSANFWVNYSFEARQSNRSADAWQQFLHANIPNVRHSFQSSCKIWRFKHIRWALRVRCGQSETAGNVVVQSIELELHILHWQPQTFDANVCQTFPFRSWRCYFQNKGWDLFMSFRCKKNDSLV